MTNYTRALFLSNTAEERVQLLWIVAKLRSNARVLSKATTAQRSSRRRSDFRCAAIQSAVVWWAKRGQQCSRIRAVLQPLTSCGDSSLRWRRQLDRDPRAQGWFQRTV